MMVRVFRLAGAAALVSVLFGCHRAEPCPTWSGQDGISLSGTSSRDDGSPIVQMTLENRSASPLRLYRAQLPWHGGGHLSLAAFGDAGFDKPLEQIGVFAETFDSSIVTIAPGQSLSGTLYLGNRFRHLDDTLKRSSVTLFWSYALETPGGGPTKQLLGGTIVVD
jgi:hypothetical protein